MAVAPHQVGLPDLLILCLGDDIDILMIAELSLSLDPALDVRIAVGREQAVAALSGPLRPDLILMDAQMRGLTGFEVARSVRRGGAHPPPVLLLTQSPDPAALSSRGTAGAVATPFDPLALAAQVRGYCTPHPDRDG